MRSALLVLCCLCGPWAVARVRTHLSSVRGLSSGLTGRLKQRDDVVLRCILSASATFPALSIC